MSAFLNYFSHKRNICIVELNIYLPLVLYVRPKAPILKCPLLQLDWTLEDHTTNERKPRRSLPLMAPIAAQLRDKHRNETKSRVR